MQRKLQIIRDAVLLIFSAVVGPSVYGQVNTEPVFVLLLGMVAAFLVLTLIDIALIITKVKSKIFFYFNAVIQIPALFILAGLFGVPFAILPIALIAINISIIRVLRKSKTALPEPKK